MKRSLFYIFMALVCAACTLAGCKKDKSGPSDSTGLGTALDNAGSANCYIVSDAGKYSFSAVKGNGKKPRQHRVRRGTLGNIRYGHGSPTG